MRPEPQYPSKSWEHYALYSRVTKLLHRPGFLSKPKAEIRVSGFDPLEAFTAMNEAAGRMVESVAVDSLNRARNEWDPNGEYADYKFVRRTRVVPDIVLQHRRRKNDILFGIELKSWNLFSKEGVPSFRYTTEANCFAIADLLVCFPWVMDGFIGGKLRFFEPYVVPARYAAESRDYYWQHKRKASSDAGISRPVSVQPYPNTDNHRVSVYPTYDGGKNFGRLARTHDMDDWCSESFKKLLHNLPCRVWYDFFMLCMREQTKARTKGRERAVKSVAVMRNRVQVEKIDALHCKLLQGIKRCLNAIESGRSGEVALRGELKKWSNIRFR